MKQYYSTDSLYHYGILGMKWGVRRYQNPDGSLTSAGRKRYGASDEIVDYAYKQKDRYGSIKVAKRDDYATTFERDGTSISVKNEDLAEMGKTAAELVLQSNGFRNVKQVDKYFKKHPSDLRLIKENIDSLIEQDLSTSLYEKGQEKALKRIQDSLEQKYPNFNKLSEDKQQELFFEEMDELGLEDDVFW